MLYESPAPKTGQFGPIFFKKELDILVYSAMARDCFPRADPVESVRDGITENPEQHALEIIIDLGSQGTTGVDEEHTV